MRALVAAAAAVLLLSACQDPAGVGLGLIDEEQLDPNARAVALTGLALVDDSTVAIGIAEVNNALPQGRVLAGAVADPLFGDVRAVTYVDFLQGSLPSEVTAADVTEAWLVLDRTYAYGDTTTALPLELRAIQGSWEATRDYRPDTLFAVGPVLSTTTVVAADTLTRFDLPTAWVRQNAALLIGDDFPDGFEGLALQTPTGYAPAPGVVWGFQTYVNSGLRVVADGDTIVYPLSEVFSSLDTDAPTAPPAGVLASRGGSQSAITFRADIGGVGTAALAQARLRAPVAGDLATTGPFRRPISARSLLFGVRGTGTDRVRSFLSEVVLADGELTVRQPRALTDSVQAVLLGGRAPFDRYEILPDPLLASLDIFPVRLPSGAATDPRFLLTLVGGAQ